jgi:hypothetical protein
MRLDYNFEAECIYILRYVIKRNTDPPSVTSLINPFSKNTDKPSTIHPSIEKLEEPYPEWWTSKEVTTQKIFID